MSEDVELLTVGLYFGVVPLRLCLLVDKNFHSSYGSKQNLNYSCALSGPTLMDNSLRNHLKTINKL